MPPRAAIALVLLLAGGLFLGAGEPTPAASPALNWVLPIFSDKEGYRVLTARGSEARPGPEKSVVVTNLRIDVFSGDADAHVDTMFLSPLATFSTRDNRARGNQTVRVIRDDLEATAVNWSYDQARKHVTLEGDVRIVFNAEIKSLLK